MRRRALLHRGAPALLALGSLLAIFALLRPDEHATASAPSRPERPSARVTTRVTAHGRLAERDGLAPRSAAPRPARDDGGLPPSRPLAPEGPRSPSCGGTAAPRARSIAGSVLDPLLRAAAGARVSLHALSDELPTEEPRSLEESALLDAAHAAGKRSAVRISRALTDHEGGFSFSVVEGRALIVTACDASGAAGLAAIGEGATASLLLVPARRLLVASSGHARVTFRIDSELGRAERVLEGSRFELLVGDGALVQLAAEQASGAVTEREVEVVSSDAELELDLR